MELKVRVCENLQQQNTLQVPSEAAHFCDVKSQRALSAAYRWADEKKVAVHLLGEGSNVLPPKWMVWWCARYFLVLRW